MNTALKRITISDWGCVYVFWKQITAKKFVKFYYNETVNFTYLLFFKLEHEDT